VNFNM